MIIEIARPTLEIRDDRRFSFTFLFGHRPHSRHYRIVHIPWFFIWAMPLATAQTLVTAFITDIAAPAAGPLLSTRFEVPFRIA
jgi:hypothetical protein